jgi:HAMP domain-containing protein
MRGAAPIVSDGVLVGSIVCGEDLAGANAFVDTFKRALDVECTVYYGDTRVTTTLLKGGERMIGTKIENPAVAESVLKNGQTFYSVNSINGMKYDTSYWPIVRGDATILGMFFIGKDRLRTEASVRSVVAVIAVSAIGFALLSVLAALFFARRVTRPLVAVAASFQELAEGDADLTRSIQVSNDDEIGDLAANFNCSSRGSGTSSPISSPPRASWRTSAGSSGRARTRPPRRESRSPNGWARSGRRRSARARTSSILPAPSNRSPRTSIHWKGSSPIRRRASRKHPPRSSR